MTGVIAAPVTRTADPSLFVIVRVRFVIWICWCQVASLPGRMSSCETRLPSKISVMLDAAGSLALPPTNRLVALAISSSRVQGLPR